MKAFTKKLICSAALLAAATGTAFAGTHVVSAPSCLISASKIHAEVLAWSDNIFLLSVDDDAIEALNDAKHQSKTPCGGFKDVTAAWNRSHLTIQQRKGNETFFKQLMTPKKVPSDVSYSIQYQTEANKLISQLNPQRMWDSLMTFSSSKDRHADSKEGVAAANWIKTEIETAAKAAGRDDVNVTLVDTDGHKQPSVVVRLGKGNEKLPGVVIGAHLDTTSSRFERKPGADDDGSGSMTVMESARTIIASGATFKKPVYFIWYSAEELGLIGSQNVVSLFQSENIPVSGVMHFDMTGFAYRNDPAIWLMKDYVDSKLTDFVEQIVKTYAKQPVKYTRCGYACSDHASWSEQGYAAVLPAESRFEDTNPVMHSAQDTIDKLSITHMTDYAKIATAFAVELAEPAGKCANL